MRINLVVYALVLVLSAQAAIAASFPARLKQEFDKHPVCATLDFDDLEVNVKDGIVRRSHEGSDRIREGDRLELIEADVTLDGLNVELELLSVHTRGETVNVEIVFYRSLRGPNNELANMDDFWKAVHYFAKDCDARSDDAG